MDRIYLDLETTGLDETGSIVEVGALFFRGGKLLSQFSSTGFDPSAKVSLNALKVNKYTFDSLFFLKPEKQLLTDLFDWILKLDSKSPELAGVNIHFDFHFIVNRAKLYNIEVGSVLPYRLHDITNISRFLQKVGLLTVKRSDSGNSLRDLADALGIQYDPSSLHSAVGDVSLYPKVDEKLEQMVKQLINKV